MSDKGLDSGVVNELKDLVQYGDGAIVSRILLKSDGGNVTLFAFDAGQELTEHTTRFSATVQVVDGIAVITVDGAAHRVGTGQIVLLPANIPHAVQAPERFKMVLTMLK